MKISIRFFLVFWAMSTSCTNHSDTTLVNESLSYISTSVYRSDSTDFRQHVQGKWKEINTTSPSVFWCFGMYDVEIDGYSHYYQRKEDQLLVSTIPYLLRSEIESDTLLLQNIHTGRTIELVRVSE